MILVIALIVTVISIICCIEIKKPAVRGILGMVVVINILIIILAVSFTYVTGYKIHEVASSTSPDGKYELLFQQVGDPEWPFGYTHAKLVLKDDSGTIAKYPFDVANDGANVYSDLWQVTWKDTCVEAVISGEEQNDNRYILFFNGKTDSNQLETKYGMTVEERWSEDLNKREEKRQQTAGCLDYNDSFENDNDPKSDEEYANQLDENGYPISEDYQSYKQEMLEIAKVIGVEDNFEVKCYLSAKGYPYAVVSSSLNNVTGEKTELHLLLNEGYEDEFRHEYVLEEYYFSAEGNELSSPAIVDFYLINSQTMEVTDEHTKSWH